MSQNERTLDFAGIGVSRCGTTWLAKCLADHPEIFVPPKKELAYYNNPERVEQQSITDYFQDADTEQLWGEYTPRYIISVDALEKLAEENPGVKTIVSLRNPVERAFSQYKYFYSLLQSSKLVPEPSQICRFYCPDLANNAQF